MRIHCPLVSPVITSSSNDSRWSVAPADDGNSDGLNCNSHHLFTAGPEIGSTLQSVGNVDILSAGENRSTGCSLLHTVSIRRWHHRCNARITHARQVNRTQVRQLCRNTPWSEW